ncbi:MAG: hypothetical protein ACOC6B_07215 [Thermodesulfobacteriota bacterium]
MGDNFKILIHRNETCLHLKLLGEFDGTAAQKLLKIVKRRARYRPRIFIHTSSLTKVHPLGTALFKEQCGDNSCSSASLIFTGDHAYRLAPRGSTRI